MHKHWFRLLLSLLLLFCLEAPLCASASAAGKKIQKIRMSWDAVPNAVMYDLVVTRGKSKDPRDFVTQKTEIYTPGYELDTTLLRLKSGDLHWMVRALDVHKQPLSDYSKPKPLLKEEINPAKPLVTGQYDRMPYAKLYPVYSWIPVAKARAYELEVYLDDDGDAATPDRLLKSERIEGQRAFDYYDDTAYVEEGAYWWRVRAKNAMNQPLGDWSERQYFTVRRDGVRVAALGDSITHGGGAVTTPPSYAMYDWQTYADYPILNAGFSGDTIENMSRRFARDIASFRPKVVVILGGINNIRLGDRGEDVIHALNILRNKCFFNRIIPVFVTVPPVNPAAMREVSGIAVAPSWQKERQKINAWIKKQPYHVDITPELTAKNGLLKSQLAADGLHPDREGKRIIGQAIGAYLTQEFGALLRRP